MSSFYLPYKRSRIHCQQWGQGDKLLICLHGFGESAAHFAFLKADLENKYRIIAIDLPGHGKTFWREELKLETKEILSWIDLILKENNKEKFSLLGYSMGGRIALAITERCPGKIDQLVLCAPDGLKINFWYWFSTQTSIGNRLFKFTMNHPGWFLSMAVALGNMRLINDRMVKYVQYYMNKAGTRELVYRTWTTMRKIRPDLLKIKSSLVSHHIPTHFFFGKYDRIIPAANAKDFRKTIEGVCSMKVLEAGHQFMNEKHAKQIASALIPNIAE